MLLANQLKDFLLSTLHAAGFRRAIFAGARRGPATAAWLRVRIRKLGSRLQTEWFDPRQSFSRMVNFQELPELVEELTGLAFSNMHIESDEEIIDARLSKRGKLHLHRQPQTQTLNVEKARHNRAKRLPVAEGQANPLLAAMGILDRSGNVRPTKRDKFRQINEFLKQFLHVLDDSKLRDLGRPIRILDCGCGSSFLTLALHDYLNNHLGLTAELIGVDINDQVIRQSIARSRKLDAGSVQLLCQSIDAVQVEADAVIALHACDTATDSALAAAIRSAARLILCVPCCHQHLNAQVVVDRIPELRSILRHGILRQRQADLLTDAFRALILRLCGYRTEVVEFIDAGHTHRNIMIRAVRSALGNTAGFLAEYDALRRFTGVVPYLETLLRKTGHFPTMLDSASSAPPCKRR